MQLLLYASPDDENRKRLVAAVSEALPHRPINIFRKLTTLQLALRAIIGPDSIAVLAAVDQLEMRQMQKLLGLLPEIFIILIVPDLKKNTIRLAHLLRPRFLCRQEDDFSNLKEVLIKMDSTPH